MIINETISKIIMSGEFHRTHKVSITIMHRREHK